MRFPNKLESAGIVFFVVIAITFVEGSSLNNRMIYGNSWFHNDVTPYTLTLGDGNFHVFDSWTNNSSFGMELVNNSTWRILYAGIYKVDYSSSFSGGGNQEYDASVFVNGVEQENTHIHRVTGSGGDVGNVGATGVVINLTTNDLLDLRFKNTDSPFADVDVKAISWVLLKIG